MKRAAASEDGGAVVKTQGKIRGTHRANALGVGRPAEWCTSKRLEGKATMEEG